MDLFDEPLNNYLIKLSSSSGTPGGGNAIGVVNAYASALMLMSVRIAVLKKSPEDDQYIRIEEELLKIREESLSFASQDSLVFKEVMKHWKKGGDELSLALRQSAEVSLRISKQALRLIELIENQDMEKFKNIITDVGISREFASACFRGGIMNCAVNVKSLKDNRGKRSRTSSDFITDLVKEKEDLEKRFNEKNNRFIEKLKKWL